MNPDAQEMNVLVFARAPIAGAAKTRLIPALGARGAARLHRSLVLRALATAREAALGPVTLCCAPDTRHRFFRALARRGLRCTAQADGDLGARMRQAFEAALAMPTLLIGSDCPALTPAHLRRAASTLSDGRDAVFLPAEDGGYVLIGLAAAAPAALFEAMPWGEDTVMECTRERLRDLGWTWSEPATLWDVDRPADLVRLGTTRIHCETRMEPI